MAFGGIYAGRRVLVTGHTGFKGGWLCLWLKQLGARVTGYSLEAPTVPGVRELFARESIGSETIGDIRDLDRLSRAVAECKPEIIFHLAAQPLVRRSYQVPVETVAVNVLGTAHILEAARHAAPGAAVVVVTTDKCYENLGFEQACHENDPLGGHDVYSASKAAAELVAQSWRRSFSSSREGLGPVATVRAGNVIGGGDYAEDRILPDLVRALMAGKPLKVRNPAAVRPWQHVLDCLGGYLVVGMRLIIEGRDSPACSAFNFGPAAGSWRTVEDLVTTFLHHWPGAWEAEDNTGQPHEARFLHLSTEKAADVLGWKPVWDFEQSVGITADWYRARHAMPGPDMLRASVEQIAAFMQDAVSQGSGWAR